MRQADSSMSESHSSGIVIAGHFNESETYVTKRPQGRQDWLITYTLEGSGYFITSGITSTCRAGDVVLLKPGIAHEYGTSKGGNWHFVWAHFSAVLMEPILLPDKEVYIQKLESESTKKRVYRAFKQVIQDSVEYRAYSQELCQNSIREVLLLLAQIGAKRMDPRIEETLRLLSEQMQEPVRIDALAGAVGLSTSRLSHLFKENTGISIVEALNRMRIRQAALLIESMDRNVMEVALDVGYQNYNYFAIQFRRQFGISPSAFKKNLQQR
ncbi:helix-turn-helix domain-containing protein [Paenibacillus eucommiae]|uniref:AraC family transcriptional regulator of arabinose operon n=1 Tax=Paenibacillus eucommiae TaxID=1355755 RepID=A0ABS4IS02_9BACL|nr:helix-turn-helix domain-containing protein [Paenibacillus eucommiae]MBP1990345.1 AraC family transcriptional regulator of arabinose operon [Paenibacillus eucommiae]